MQVFYMYTYIKDLKLENGTFEIYFGITKSQTVLI